MKKRTFLESVNNAVEGFIYVIKTERNMRVHFLLAFMVLILAIFLHVSRVEWMLLCLTICFVLITEMINTAIEEAVDLIEKALHPGIRVIKDISAGAVMVSGVNALIVGFFIFSKYWSWPLGGTHEVTRYSSWHITFIALMIVVFLVIAGKAFFHRGTPFRGGVVSGHAAVAFSLWTVTLFTQNNVVVIGVVLMLALLVAQSRVRSHIHSIWEVCVGSILGILVTALFFKIFG